MRTAIGLILLMCSFRAMKEAILLSMLIEIIGIVSVFGLVCLDINDEVSNLGREYFLRRCDDRCRL